MNKTQLTGITTTGSASDFPEKPELQYPDVDYLIDMIEVDRIYHIMEATDWFWFGEGVPSPLSIIRTMERLIKEVFNEINELYKSGKDYPIESEMATGGFTVRGLLCDENTPKPDFSVHFGLTADTFN